MATAYITGVQSQGIGCCIKHFVCNDTEKQRFTVSVEITNRALREVYARPFQMAIQAAKYNLNLITLNVARPWVVMTAYNKINGTYCNENSQICDLLRKELLFDGLVISDWYLTPFFPTNILRGGTRSFNVFGVDLMDIEMPGPVKYASPEAVKRAIDQKIFQPEAYDKRVNHTVCHKLIRIGVPHFCHIQQNNSSISIFSPSRSQRVTIKSC